MQMLVDGAENRPMALKEAPAADRVVWLVGGLYVYQCTVDEPHLYHSGEKSRVGWMFLEIEPTSVADQYRVKVTASRVATGRLEAPHLLDVHVPWKAEGMFQEDSGTLILSYTIDHRDEFGRSEDRLEYLPDTMKGTFVHKGNPEIKGTVSIKKITDAASVPQGLARAISDTNLRAGLTNEVIGRRGAVLAQIFRGFNNEVSGTDLIIDIVTQNVRYASQGTYIKTARELFDNFSASVLYTEQANGSPMRVRSTEGRSSS